MVGADPSSIAVSSPPRDGWDGWQGHRSIVPHHAGLGPAQRVAAPAAAPSPASDAVVHEHEGAAGGPDVQLFEEEGQDTLPLHGAQLVQASCGDKRQITPSASFTRVCVRSAAHRQLIM